MGTKVVSILAVGMLVLTLSACASGDKLGQDADALRTALVGSPVQVTKLDGSVVITSTAEGIFPSGGWQIPADSPVLNKMLPTLTQLQQTQITIGGYTDNMPIGPQLQAEGIANNTDLSTKRAQSVASYLTSHGVNPNLVSSQGYGEANPVVSNTTAEGRARNRRVDLTLTGNGS
jgi:chemotaxis protein MotB